MKLVELLDIANRNYPDGYLSEYYNRDGSINSDSTGDALAQFVVLELSDTFDADCHHRPTQIKIAVVAMRSAIRELEGVLESLMNTWMDEVSG